MSRSETLKQSIIFTPVLHKIRHLLKYVSYALTTMIKLRSSMEGLIRTTTKFERKNDSTNLLFAFVIQNLHDHPPMNLIIQILILQAIHKLIIIKCEITSCHVIFNQIIK